MNKKLSMGLLILGSFGSEAWAAWGGDFRAPLDILYRGHAHWDFAPVTDTWWYDVMGVECDPCCAPSKYSMEIWTGAFTRVAGKSFLKINDCNGVETQSNATTSQTTTLPTIIFGKSTFIVTEALAGGGIDTTLTEDVTLIDDTTTTVFPQIDALNNLNPLLGVLRVTPNFDYTEYGAVWGVRVERRFGCEEDWYAGVSAAIPFKIIESRMDEGCAFQEEFGDVVRVVPIVTQATATAAGNLFIPEDVTVRLDVLSSVVFQNLQYVTAPNSRIPFVNFGDGTNPTRFFYFASDGATGQDVPVLLVREASGNVDNVAYPYRKTVNVSGSSPLLPAEVPTAALQADGSGGVNGSTLFFKTGTDYAASLGNNPAAQAELFVVFPTENITDSNLSGQDALANGTSKTIYDGVMQIVRDLSVGDQAGPIDFLCNQGIDLMGLQRTIGVGDLDLYIYGGYGHRWDWFAELELGVKAPTGTKITDAHDILKFPTGNNKHWELMFGMQGGWQPINWFAFQLDWSYHHAFRRSQEMLATFEGSAVKNLGPVVNGKVAWNYFLVHADMTFFHPCNPELGFMVGYELFAKKRDQIEYCTEKATDFLGTEQTLDPCLAAQGTNAMLHKIRGEMFHRWNYCEILLGGSTAVGGRHAMKETEGHITLTIYF